ncbi:MAG: hypothetical protein GY753_20245, partial [Gammaproteobacteria bacterium]|nr:hypothetical protein [Gammaproteobacteria bacterium]
MAENPFNYHAVAVSLPTMHPMINIAVRAARSAGNILLRYYEHTDSLTVTEKRKNEFVSEVDKA